MSDNRFENLISEVSSKANLDREKIIELVREKKTRVGGGYLTDQGALFLVASDLGVDVNYYHDKRQQKQQQPASLSRISADQKSLTVFARVLSMTLPKSFMRKTDSRKGLVSRLTIYDGSGTASVTLWDATALNLLDDSLGIRPGDMVKISNAYTRVGLDGLPVINLGENAEIEKVKGDSQEVGQKISPLNENIIAPHLISGGAKFLAVRGRVDGEVRRNSFTRSSDGSASEYTSFSLADESSRMEGQTSTTVTAVRVVIWGNQDPAFREIQSGDLITLLNVRAKLSNYQNSSGLEIHGDEGTCILEHFEQTRKWMKEQVSGQGAISGGLSTAQQKEMKKIQPTGIPFVGRVIAIRKSGGSSDGRAHLLIVDSQKRKISVVVSGDALQDLEEKNLQLDEVIVCRPDAVDYVTLKATCSKAGSFSKASSKRPDILASSSFFSKVEDLRDGDVSSLEAISLSEPVTKEIQTKDGLVRRTEVTVADHTGEIKVYGWRNLSKLLEGLSTGERIVLHAVEVQLYEGKKFIVVKNYSSVDKKN